MPGGAQALAWLAVSLGLWTSASAFAPPGPAPWVRPDGSPDAKPVWGLADGLAIGLHPMPGPRGLIRIYASYLGHPPGRMVNYVSIEPVNRGRRGQSELEPSAGDGKPGKLIQAFDTLEEARKGPPPEAPARGREIQEEGVPALTVFFRVEPFRNGSAPIIQAVIRSDRPHEVAFRVFTAPGGPVMSSCVLSATMGNYMRLRRLGLKDEVVESGRLWPSFQPDPLGFAPWRAWSLDRLRVDNGRAIVSAWTDEEDPASATYDPKVPRWWRYTGLPAVQEWNGPAVPGLVARVNGRSTYWGVGGPIPGGVSFENFELEAPFEEGQEFRLAIRPSGPRVPGAKPGD